jgi:hypothetical protein
VTDYYNIYYGFINDCLIHTLVSRLLPDNLNSDLSAAGNNGRGNLFGHQEETVRGRSVSS